jgi:hypothetical protein
MLGNPVVRTLQVQETAIKRLLWRGSVNKVLQGKYLVNSGLPWPKASLSGIAQIAVFSERNKPLV